MTWSNILTWPASTEGSWGRYFRKLIVAQKAFFVCHSANIDLFRNAFMVKSVCTRVFWPTPTNDRPKWMNKHRVKIWQANWLNRRCEWNWIFHCSDSNISVEIIRFVIPIRMNFDLHKFTLLWRAFKISQIVFSSVNIRVQHTMNRAGIPLRPKAVSR